MKYRIKNKKLEELVYSLFDEEIVQKEISNHIEDSSDFVYFRNTKCELKDLKENRKFLFFPKSILKIGVPKSAIEKVREYDPDDWNPYPEVKPPRYGQYLVQWKKGPEGCGEEFPLGVYFWDKYETWTGIEAFRELPELYQPEEQECPNS